MNRYIRRHLDLFHRSEFETGYISTWISKDSYHGPRDKFRSYPAYVWARRHQHDHGQQLRLPHALTGTFTGIDRPYPAIVHGVICTHGAVVDNPYAQLTTFTADCNPDCANVQASVHLPVEK